MKIFRLKIIALFSLLLIAGCSKREELPKPSIDIVGHWKMSDIETKGANPNDDSDAKARESRLEVIFRADQSCKVTIWDRSGEVTDNIEGRYLLEGDALTISGPTIRNYKFNLSTSSGNLILYNDDDNTEVILTLTKLSEESKIHDEQDANLIPQSLATDAALAHFRETTPALAEHLVHLGDPKPVVGPGGRAWHVFLFDKRRGNPSFMQPNQIDDASHSLIILGTKGNPVVISNKKQMDDYKDVPE